MSGLLLPDDRTFLCRLLKAAMKMLEYNACIQDALIISSESGSLCNVRVAPACEPYMPDLGAMQDAEQRQSCTCSRLKRKGEIGQDTVRRNPRDRKKGVGVADRQTRSVTVTTGDHIPC